MFKKNRVILVSLFVFLFFTILTLIQLLPKNFSGNNLSFNVRNGRIVKILLGNTEQGFPIEINTTSQKDYSIETIVSDEDFSGPVFRKSPLDLDFFKKSDHQYYEDSLSLEGNYYEFLVISKKPVTFDIYEQLILQCSHYIDSKFLANVKIVPTDGTIINTIFLGILFSVSVTMFLLIVIENLKKLEIKKRQINKIRFQKNLILIIGLATILVILISTFQLIPKTFSESGKNFKVYSNWFIEINSDSDFWILGKNETAVTLFTVEEKPSMECWEMWFKNGEDFFIGVPGNPGTDVSQLRFSSVTSGTPYFETDPITCSGEFTFKVLSEKPANLGVYLDEKGSNLYVHVYPNTQAVLERLLDNSIRAFRITIIIVLVYWLLCKFKIHIKSS